MYKWIIPLDTVSSCYINVLYFTRKKNNNNNNNKRNTYRNYYGKIINVLLWLSKLGRFLNLELNQLPTCSCEKYWWTIINNFYSILHANYFIDNHTIYYIKLYIIIIIVENNFYFDLSSFMSIQENKIEYNMYYNMLQ